MSSRDHSFFGFRTFDRNNNEIDLSEFKNKDYIVIVNCLVQDEAEERAAFYISIEDKFETKVQTLCVPAAKFMYDGHQNEESQTLIDYLKKKSNCQNDVEDGLIFVVENRMHTPSKEVVHYVGNNLPINQLTDEISKIMNK